MSKLSAADRERRGSTASADTMRLRSFIIIAVIAFLGCGCSSLRKPETSIRRTLLKKTHVGSSYQSVWRYVERRGWGPTAEKPDLRVFLGARTDWETRGENGRRTYWMKSDGTSRKVSPDEFTIGTRWIRAGLGRYWHRNGWGKRGISCYHIVDAYWCFDGENRLLDIVVSKRSEF